MSQNYTVLPQLIGKGSFGHVYLGMDKRDGHLVAVKTETKTDAKPLLKMENNIIKYATQSLTNKDPPSGIIRSYFFWEDSYKYFMVTDLLGPSIGALHKICCRSFSLKTTLMLTEQMINIIRYYHSNNIVHRDIKPDNFLVEYNVPHKHIYLIDFGLSKKYVINGKHIPYATNITRVGSLRYMSKNMHDCVEASRRDDMYSIGYVVVYLFTGMLPWQSSDILKVPKKGRYEFVGNIKKTTSNEKLCQHLQCPQCRKNGTNCSFKQCMTLYFDYLDSLDFTDDINYNYILKEVLTCMKSHGLQYDHSWDWNKYYDLGSGSGSHRGPGSVPGSGVSGS